MTPTRPGSLAIAALVGVPVGWTLGRLGDAGGSVLTAVPWLSVALLAFLAVLLLVAARTVHGWVTERRHDRRMGPLVVSRLVVLAKAAAVCGAVLAGLYGGVALVVVQAGDDPGLLLRPGVAVAASAAVLVAGLLLERACRVPPVLDDEAGPSGVT